MKTLAMTLMSFGLALCPALYAMTDPLPAPPGETRIEAAKSAEVKGDQARRDQNYMGAIYLYLDAIRENPQDAMLYNKLGIAEVQLGSRREGRKYFAMALKHDPRNVVAYNNLGAVACLDHKYKAAVRYLKQALELNESDATAHLNMAEAWMGLHQEQRAITEYSRALELDADILNSGTNGVIAQVHTPEQRAIISFLIARAYAKRGNIDGALEYLRRAKEDRYPGLSQVYTEPEFAAVVNDPRLEKIVKR